MYGGMKDLPILRNYDDALAHWKLIKPIRGRSSDVRPLCLFKRNKDHLLIERTTVDGVDAVGCKLYKTNVVTFVSDGRIVIDNSWPSLSTNNFAGAILGRGAYMRSQGGNTWIHTLAGQFLVGSELVLKREVRGLVTMLVPVNPTPSYVHKLDRAKYKQVMAAYKPFISHVRNVAKLLGEDAKAQVCGMPPHLLETAANPDREGWGPLIDYLFACSMKAQWQVSSPGVPGGYVRTLDIERGLQYLVDAIKTEHAHEIFYKEAVPLGQYKEDTNRRFAQ